MNKIIPECLSCGACCINNDSKWIEVTEEDAKRIDSDMLQSGDIEAYAMKMHLKRCIALDVNNHCTIYANRPQICRDVERGSPICLYSLDE